MGATDGACRRNSLSSARHVTNRMAKQMRTASLGCGWVTSKPAVFDGNIDDALWCYSRPWSLSLTVRKQIQLRIENQKNLKPT